MSQHESDLLAKILRLPPSVRAQFAHEILASLDDPAETEVEGRWTAEIERRADEVLSGLAELEDADLVHEQLAARLAATRR
ncbi:addiction module protein [Sorangium sp. So ce327]|jgi:putative addiction module component (TIGR02574 family)|uniref:addiction module protein n=1 Tax=unclassified Sorangium TaxID=2621164 RepID=UPI003F613BFD